MHAVELKCVKKAYRLDEVSVDVLKIELDSPIAVYQKNCVLASADVMPRIIGRGEISA